MLRIRLAITLSVLASTVYAEYIHGTVIVKQRLTRKRVTAAPSLYQRGAAVELRSDPPREEVVTLHRFAHRRPGEHIYVNPRGIAGQIKNHLSLAPSGSRGVQ